jgi:hypothetical protein
MTSSEIYNISFFEKKNDYNKTISFTQNYLIIITGNVKQHRAQICVEAIQILWFAMKKNIIVQ